MFDQHDKQQMFNKNTKVVLVPGLLFDQKVILVLPQICELHLLIQSHICQFLPDSQYGSSNWKAGFQSGSQVRKASSNGENAPLLTQATSYSSQTGVPLKPQGRTN